MTLLTQESFERILDQKLDQKLDEKLEDKFEEKLGPIREDISNLKTDVATLKTNLEDIKETVERIDKRDLEDSNAFSKDILGLKRRVTRLQKQRKPHTQAA